MLETGFSKWWGSTTLTLHNGKKINLFYQYISDYGGKLFGGPIESMQTIFIIAVSILCFFRFYRLKKKPFIFRCSIFLMAFFSLLLFLEEISFGQRIFDFEVPAFFKKYNNQKEINLHNLYNLRFDNSGITFDNNGSTVDRRIKRWVKGILIPLYLFLLPMLFYLPQSIFSATNKFGKKLSNVRGLINSLALPIPRIIHVIVYIFFPLLIFRKEWSDEGKELLITLVFFMIFLYPMNKAIFEKDCL